MAKVTAYFFDAAALKGDVFFFFLPGGVGFCGFPFPRKTLVCCLLPF